MKNALLTTTAGTPIEFWFQDEARVGQKGSLTYVWAPIGSCRLMVRDNRHDLAYLFGAICPARAVGAAIIMPAANAEAMTEHLNEISTQVAPGAHAVLVCDGAGWHQNGRKLIVPDNITLLPLPPHAPELNQWRTCGNISVPTNSAEWSGIDTTPLSQPAETDGTSLSMTQTGSDQSATGTGNVSMSERIGINRGRMPIAGRAPHRTVRAEFSHTAPTLGVVAS
jgi:hypothetical protein